jgi:hypothetical protein
MRYLKGSLFLNRRDRDLLHAVADARYITHSQLFQLGRYMAITFDRPVFNWRVRRLVNGGLLRKQVVSYLGAEALYSITRSGVQALEEMGICFLGGYVEREKDPHEFQLPHVLELNRIHIALLGSGALTRWIPESFIRVVNLSPIHGYAKTYDAVVTLRLGDGEWAELAIEYERTLKSVQKYEKIFEAIENEKRLHTILYLSSSFEILSTLRCYFERARRLILFAGLEDFKEHVLNANVDSVRGYRRNTLREALVGGIAERKASVSA